MADNYSHSLPCFLRWNCPVAVHLTKQTKKSVLPRSAFELMVQTQVQDMRIAGKTAANTAKSVRSDARTCLGVPDDFADLIITSPAYANNYDYADATRL